MEQAQRLLPHVPPELPGQSSSRTRCGPTHPRQTRSARRRCPRRGTAGRRLPPRGSIVVRRRYTGIRSSGRVLPSTAARARASEGRGRAGVQGVFERVLDLVHGDEDGRGGRDHDDGVVGFCVREVSVGAVSIWQRLRGESGTCFVCARAVCVWSVSCKACQGRRQTKWWGAGRT